MKKVYIVMVKAYTVDGLGHIKRMVMADVLNVFDVYDNAVEYIEENWPEAKRYGHKYCEGVKWVFGPNKDFSWQAVYKIVEKEIEL